MHNRQLNSHNSKNENFGNFGRTKNIYLDADKNSISEDTAWQNFQNFVHILLLFSF